MHVPGQIPGHWSARRWSRVIGAALALALLLAILPPAPPVAQALSTTVVISQVYGGAGCGTAGCSTYKNDYIELFNRGGAPASVNGWSVQYAAATGTSWQVTPLPNVSIPAGGYLLVAEGAGANGVNNLPTPDVTGTINMSATGAKVALASSTTALSVACPIGAGVVDFVGYGTTATCFEGSGTAPAPSTTTADIRAGSSCTETDNNATDFTAAAPNPRNSATPVSPCGGDSAPSVSTTSPTNNAPNVALNSNIVVNFSEPVTAPASAFALACGGPIAFTLTPASGSAAQFTLDPNADLPSGTACTLTITGSAVKDVDGPADPMASNFTLNFTTGVVQVPGPLKVYDIQGAAHISPKVGQSVTNVPGIVTAKASNGFYLQDATGDNNPATSDGIFVFTGSAPSVAVGDAVLVSGQVQEFRPGCNNCQPTDSAFNNLTITELGNVTSVFVQSSGNPLPAATVIGQGGRVPPTEVINDDGTGNIENSGSYDPNTDGIDFYESLEGMRVQVNNPLVVGPTNSFGETFFLADNGTGATSRSERGGVIVKPGDFNPERIKVDDALTSNPSLNVGDHLTGPIVGVLTYDFANYTVLNTQPLTGLVPGNLPREATNLTGSADKVTIATFNVENLDPSDGPTKFNTLADRIVNNLKSPDIIVVEEVQDNNGATNDSVVDANITITTLTTAIQSAGGPSYQFRQINPVDDTNGGEPGGNIRVVFLFNEGRVSFVDRAGGSPTTATTVTNNGGVPVLSSSPGLIDPTNPAFNASRKPLVGEFTFKGRTIFVIGNHWNSKGGDQPLFGRFQPPALGSETQRLQQANVVKGFVQSILTIDPTARIVLGGDFNDFAFSAPLSTLLGTNPPLTSLITTLDPDKQYSYVFEGNSQVLDHLIASQSMRSALDAFDVVHINAEFAEQVSDHDPSVARFLVDTTPPTVACSATPTSMWPPNHQLKPVTLTVTVTDENGGSGAAGWKLVSVTSNEPDNGTGEGDLPSDIQDWSLGTADTTGQLRAERSESGSGRVYTLVVEGRDQQGNTAQCTTTVTVPHDQGH